jgi:putative ABC transport system substrate-binding protein
VLTALPPLLAQEAEKAPHIGVLMAGSPATSNRYTATLRESLRTFGYDDGRNIVIDPRYAEGDYERLPKMVTELINQKVKLFVAGNERALITAKSAGAGIPIVVVACDPLEKLLGSIARPGGSATGVTCVSADLIGPRFSYLKAVVPNLKRIALLYNAADIHESELRGADVASRSLGIETIRFPVRSAEDFASTFDSIVREKCEALYISLSAFTNFHRKTLAELALFHRLAAITSGPEFPEAGGLMSYGATLEDGFKRSAYFVDRILKGASPRDLPAEEPTKFYLVVNIKTAFALGIQIPDIVLVRADKIIE